MTKRRAIAGAGRQAPRRPRRVIESILIAIGCILFADALVGERGVVAMLRARDDRSALVQKLERARETHRRLTEDVRRIREDPDALEDLARRELLLVKEGEKLFIIRGVTPPAR